MVDEKNARKLAKTNIKNIKIFEFCSLFNQLFHTEVNVYEGML